MEVSLPYVQAHSNIKKVLEKIREASVPERFTQDYLATKLGIKSSAAKPVIPFLKRIGFLSADAVPTNRYKQFRNSSESGTAAAEGLREGYSALFEVNEYAQDLSDTDLKGIVVQVTGLEPDARNTQAIVGSFKALKDFASFDAECSVSDEGGGAASADTSLNGELEIPNRGRINGIGISYTINLNLPSTSDISVFNAIFSSLKENLL